MGFAKARFRLIGDKGSVEGVALVDGGAWYTIVDERLAEYLGVKYTGLSLTLTSFSGHRIMCREAIISSVAIEGKVAPSELVAVCPITEPIRELLNTHEVDDRLVIGVHTLERLAYAVDVTTHRLIQSPGILMLIAIIRGVQ
jgi:predicted aspartyl protease